MASPFTELMRAAKAHALGCNALIPVLSPEDASLLSASPDVNVRELHELGIRIVPWTTNDPALMRKLIAMGIDGLISDRPDLLQQVLAEVRGSDPAIAVDFDVAGHRGARGLRPENTLPAFEAGLDSLVTTLETDTGVTRDRKSILGHDQFLNPECCRRAGGQRYDFQDAVFLRDITLADAQKTFVCDKLHPARFPAQRNDPALSPVAVAFAEQENLKSPYAPVATDQLFRFVAFYTTFYLSGNGRAHPDAAHRSINASRVRFNLEIKILPFPDGGNAKPKPGEEPVSNHTVDAQTFVATLCEVIARAGMNARCEVQSFDFRTLQLIEKLFPKIQTYYLTSDPSLLTSEFVPATLRQG